MLLSYYMKECASIADRGDGVALFAIAHNLERNSR